MPTTILFDLDGTLLPINTDDFVRNYMKALATHMAGVIPPKLLVEQLLSSTMAMIGNTDPDQTNARAFANDFFPRVGRPEAELMPLFEGFYERVFPGLSRFFPGLPGAGLGAVQAAVDRGFEIALATNPLFPRRAIEARMRWIGVDQMPWRLVTAYEEMHFCKPHSGYYHEVLSILGRRPDQCLMVGNDTEEDGAAVTVGIPVYYVTDFLINRSGSPLPPERTGSLADLTSFLEILPVA